MKTQREILIQDSEFRKLLSVETLAAEASEEIAKLMAEQQVTKAELARLLNKSRAWVTQVLSGKANLTVRTLAEIADALNAEIKLSAQPIQTKSVGARTSSTSRVLQYKFNDHIVEPPSDSRYHVHIENRPDKCDESPVQRDDRRDPVPSDYAA